MGKSKIFYYLVEGENEKKLVETIKEKEYIPSGKIRVFNIIHYIFVNFLFFSLKILVTCYCFSKEIFYSKLLEN